MTQIPRRTERGRVAHGAESDDVPPEAAGYLKFFDDFLEEGEFGLALHALCDYLLEPDVPAVDGGFIVLWALRPFGNAAFRSTRLKNRRRAIGRTTAGSIGTFDGGSMAR